MSNFETSLIRDIKYDSPSTWEEKVFITIDVDWSNDTVFQYTIDFLNKYACKATIFATHSSSLLNTLRKNGNFEIGIHPNFNYLLEGDFRYGETSEQVLKHWLDLVPEAISVRSHSMTQNTPILKEFTSHGIQFDCNHFFPFNGKESHLHPFLFWDNKLVRVPYFWEDDVNLLSYENRFSAKEVLSYKGLKVFNFHPIHIYLNTYNLDHYSRARPFYGDVSKLESFVNTEKYGVRDFFGELLSLINSKSTKK